MPANKIGSYIVHYRSRKKEEAEQERQQRIEDAKRAPKIVDPSFELFGYTSPPSHINQDAYQPQMTTSPSNVQNDDWVFQNRKANTVPQPYQFEPYCEVTPKSSVSSSNSAYSDTKPVPEYDMGWDTTTTTRPRPQSYLPSAVSANYSMSTSDLHRSRRQTTYHDTSPVYHSEQQNKTPQTSSSYRVASSLTRPFSIDDPLEALAEPVADSHLYSQAPRSASYNTTWDVPSTRGPYGRR